MSRQYAQVIHSYDGVMCEVTYEGKNKTRHGVILSFAASLVLSTFSMDCKNAGCVQ